MYAPTARLARNDVTSLCHAVATVLSIMLLLLHHLKAGMRADTPAPVAMVYPVCIRPRIKARDIDQPQIPSLPPQPAPRPQVAFRKALALCELATLPHIPNGMPSSMVEPTLCVQAQRLLETTGLYLDEISVRYFQGIHTFVPIISRRRFHAHLLSFGANPQADFTLLLLCMALLIYCADPPDHSGPQGGHRVEYLTLYVATKSLMAQAQALRTPTTQLIQAGVLLAVYEYARGRPEQAFVTIGSYTRMSYAARLRSTPSVTITGPLRTDWTTEEEEISTWWGIRICERTFLCELAIVNQPLGSMMPARDDRLPLEPAILDQRNPATALTSGVAIQALNSSQVGSFGRAAQAAWLLDGVLQALSMADPDQKHAHLTECNRTLQSFLAVIMQQHGGNYGMLCVPIALTIRSHQILDTITKMVIDIATAHEHLPISQIDHLPPSCLYIIRAALKNINDYQSATPDPRLQASLNQFQARWCTSSAG
ncbi:hypothetical protein N7463_008652 [Penicillium fimorum]|uniref:Xylanolytic transcriptional activator regulatory domain-containing protein n=1 Tax=Penicillium fimorum TaxID=1882269 RepID=A0A9W9XQ51_9EURO|nr:hypothetical protein N7463_008652 [Penicillium fimorum]